MQFNWIHAYLDDSMIGDSITNAFAAYVQLDF